MIAEDEVYEGAKTTLLKEGWTIVAGQPPNGNDAYPVVEIKSPGRVANGSLGAFKPDLVALKEDTVLLVECKPEFDHTDESKLINILRDPKRLEEFLEELRQRGILRRHKVVEPPRGLRFAGALAHGWTYINTSLGTLLIQEWNVAGRFVPPSVAVRFVGGRLEPEVF